VAIYYSSGAGANWTILVCIFAIPAGCVPGGEPLQGSIFFFHGTPLRLKPEVMHRVSLQDTNYTEKEGARVIVGLINAKAPLPQGLCCRKAELYQKDFFRFTVLGSEGCPVVENEILKQDQEEGV